MALILGFARATGEIPAGTAEDVDAVVAAARAALKRNRGRDWARAPGAVRAKYLRAIAAKVRWSSLLYANLIGPKTTPVLCPCFQALVPTS